MREEEREGGRRKRGREGGERQERNVSDSVCVMDYSPWSSKS